MAKLLNRISTHIRYLAPLVLPDELTAAEHIHVSNKYEDIADKYAEIIAGYFDAKVNCHATHPGVRMELIDNSFIAADLQGIASHYNAKIVELSIFRLQGTKRKSDRGEQMPTEDGWVSEVWHSDNFPATDFKIIIYLTDVGAKQGPFEYKYPVEYVTPRPFLKLRDTRRAYDGQGRLVTGRRGTTLIFKNNIIHKGNYCREGYRDVVMIGLRLPGFMARLMSAHRGCMGGYMDAIRGRRKP
jgi:hypothetical protein